MWPEHSCRGFRVCRATEAVACRARFTVRVSWSLIVVSLAAVIAMLVWILPIGKGFGMTWQERGRRLRRATGTILWVDTHGAGVVSCRLLTTSDGTSRVRAQHTRGRRRPLRPKGLTTLALRPLHRQPTGVLALHGTTCRLYHPGVRTRAKPV